MSGHPQGVNPARRGTARAVSTDWPVNSERQDEGRPSVARLSSAGGPDRAEERKKPPTTTDGGKESNPARRGTARAVSTDWPVNSENSTRRGPPLRSPPVFSRRARQGRREEKKPPTTTDGGKESTPARRGTARAVSTDWPVNSEQQDGEHASVARLSSAGGPDRAEKRKKITDEH